MLTGVTFKLGYHILKYNMHKKWNFPLRISSGNVLRILSHVLKKFHSFKTSFFMQCNMQALTHLWKSSHIKKFAHTSLKIPLEEWQQSLLGTNFYPWHEFSRTTNFHTMLLGETPFYVNYAWPNLFLLWTDLECCSGK